MSILLYRFPFQSDALQYIGIAIFVLNIVLFVLFAFMDVFRYAIWPEVFWLMVKHPAQSLFLGTLPMGFATIVNMVVFVCVPSFGYQYVSLSPANVRFNMSNKACAR